MAVSTVSTNPSQMFVPYLLRAAQSVQNVATQPFTPYTGERVATTSPLEQRAFNTAASYNLPEEYGTASSAMEQGIRGLLSRGQGDNRFSELSDQARQQYMNPYQSSVTDIAKREAETEFLKNQSQLRARAAGAGAFGGSRATLLETEANRGYGQLQNDITTKGLMQAYEDAKKLYQQEFQNETGALESAISGARGLGDLARTMSQDELARVGQMAELGQQQRGVEQAKADAAYSNYLDARDYPMERAKLFATGISGLSGGYGTKTEQTPEPSTLNSILGTVATGAGILGDLGDGDAGKGWDFLVREFGPSVEGAWDFFTGFFD